MPAVRAFKLNEFWEQCVQCFKDYPSQLLDKLFDTKMAVVKACLAAGGDGVGDNTYKQDRCPAKKREASE